MSKRVLIIGSGFFGAVSARELTNAGHQCQVIEKRDHIGGNCYTRYSPEADSHQHVYGAHIFHTNSEKIWSYINQYAAFNNYVNRVKAAHGDRLYSFPINLLTLHQLFGVRTPQEAKARIAEDCIPNANPKNMEEYCLATFGRSIYETFFYGYSRKQWNRDPKELPAAIARRVLIRFNFDDNYFADRYQGIPIGGYTAIFQKLLDGIPVELQTDFFADQEAWLRKYDHVIFTGPIDAYFKRQFGALEYRSLRWDTELLDTPDAQGCAVVNHTSADIPYTRTYEHKHFDLNYTRDQTLLTKEYPIDWKPGGLEVYPVNTDENQALYAKYSAAANELEGKVTFGGRLGSYRYYDMHQVIGAALKTASDLIDSWR
ncbi:UDP-galactopyranose mutase [Verrucomicrobiia bacterium DG1235]|nr:UDP-galactopyranose mutase [Verrucomicrobiae bacterium DG1235]